MHTGLKAGTDQLRAVNLKTNTTKIMPLKGQNLELSNHTCDDDTAAAVAERATFQETVNKI
jgi:hypothetical protein